MNAVIGDMLNFIVSGIEWSLDTEASNATVLVASEAHAITLAIEGLLGVVFAVATLTDEAVDDGEVRCRVFVFCFSIFAVQFSQFLFLYLTKSVLTSFLCRNY